MDIAAGVNGYRSYLFNMTTVPPDYDFEVVVSNAKTVVIGSFGGKIKRCEDGNGDWVEMGMFDQTWTSPTVALCS